MASNTEQKFERHPIEDAAVAKKSDENVRFFMMTRVDRKYWESPNGIFLDRMLQKLERPLDIKWIKSLSGLYGEIQLTIQTVQMAQVAMCRQFNLNDDDLEYTSVQGYLDKILEKVVSEYKDKIDYIVDQETGKNGEESFIDTISSNIMGGISNLARDEAHKMQIFEKIAARCGFGELISQKNQIGAEKTYERDTRGNSTDLNSPPGGQYYSNRINRKQNAHGFIKEVYGLAGWLNGEFTRADLRRIDPKAAAALNNFENQRGNKLTLDELNLPTVKERYDKLLAAGELNETLKAGERVRGAIRRRLKNI